MNTTTNAVRVASIVSAIDAALTNGERGNVIMMRGVIDAVRGLETFAASEALKPDVLTAITGKRWYAEASALDMATRALRVAQGVLFAGYDLPTYKGTGGELAVGSLEMASMGARKALQKLGLIQTRTRGAKSGSRRDMKAKGVAPGTPDATMVERAALKLVDERTAALQGAAEFAKNQAARAATDVIVATAKLEAVNSDWHGARQALTALELVVSPMLATMTTAKATPIVEALRALAEVVSRNAPKPAIAAAPVEVAKRTKRAA